MMHYPLAIGSILERAGLYFGTREIVSRLPDRSVFRYHYADFHRRSRTLASALLRAGLRRGDRVGTLMWNHHVHLESYFAIPSAGGVLHTLNLRLHPNELAFIVNHAEDRFLIVDDALLPLLEQFRDRIKPERVFVVSLCGKPVAAPYESYDQLLETGDPSEPLPQIEEREAAAMCYTSGTTGSPKGVVYTHRSAMLHSMASAWSDAMALSRRDTILPVVPMFHANAWGMPFAGTMVGAKFVFPGPFLDAESILDLLDSEKVTVTGGVPTVWMAVIEALEKNPGRWNLVKGMRMPCGGSAPPEAMIRTLEKHGLHLLHAYGLTESSPLAYVCKLRPGMRDWPDERAFTVRRLQGRQMPFVQSRIVNDNGIAPWDGSTLGELQMRGPWITASYYNLPAERDKWTEDGWFRTGDVGSLNPEGYLKIADRTKDLIKSGGEWISSVDLENALMGHPAVKEAAVIAIPDAKWAERPLAVVVPKDAAACTPEVLRAFLAERFAKWQIPESFEFVEAIPHTSTGKMLKAELRKRFAPQPPHGGEPEGARK
jgi:fatty-acyl-CoA synthase